MASIVVSCQTCGQRFKAPESAVGKKVKCTFCEGEIIIAAAGDPELSMSGFIDLNDEPAAKPAPELPSRRDLPRRTKTKARTRDRETLFDLSADDVPRRRPRPSAKPAAAAPRGNTGVRRRPEPEPERGGRGGGGGGRGGSSAGRGAKKPLNPMVLLAAGGGGLLLLILIVVGLAVSSANETERVRRVTIKKQTDDAARLEKEGKARRRAELKERFKSAKDKADELYTKEKDGWEAIRAQKRAQGIKLEDEAFRSEGAGKAFVDAARAAEDANERRVAAKYFGKAIEVDPENKTARVALGHERYKKPTDDTIDALAMEGLLEELDKAHDKWFDKDGLAKMQATEVRVIAAAKAEMDRRVNDPIYKVVAQVRRNIRSMEILKDIEWEDSYAKPYLIFEQKRKGQDDDDPAAAARLQNKLAILQHLYSYFGERWAKPFGLKRNESAPLKILVMRDVKAFDEYNAKAGVGAPPGVIAYYEIRNKWVVLYNGLRTGDPRHTPKQREEYNDGVTFHEGTHQLVDAYVNEGKEGIRERIGRSRWLDEGMCEYIGAVQVERRGGEKTWTLEQRHHTRVEELYGWVNPEANPLVNMVRQAMKAANPNMPEMGPAPPMFLTLREMVSSYTYNHVNSMMARKYANTPFGPLLARGAGTSIIYAQAVQFWDFCMKHENGKYQVPMMNYLKWEWGLRPGSPPPLDPRRAAGQCVKAFEMIFKEVDIDQLELEYWLYCDKLIKEVVGPGKGVPQALFDQLAKKK